MFLTPLSFTPATVTQIIGILERFAAYAVNRYCFPKAAGIL